ncbi:hypothetical protein IFR05_005265 [Cadophora sp. M221]|nr:hypothetical protein IFR05_005265 [Cadophora sp. M221]
MVNDPSSGPFILFEPPGLADKQPKALEYPGSGATSSDNNSINNNKNDYMQVALIGTPKDVERMKLQSDWNEH